MWLQGRAGWFVIAALVAGFILLPLLAVVVLALTPTENIWPHLLATTLPRYLGNTIVLMLSVGVLSGAVGVGAAWLLTMYRFPLANLFRWAMLMPLALPAYVSAYALVDFLEYAGPVQTGLRSVFGWQSSRDYWFFDVRSMGMAVVVLSGALFPYVYLLARAAFQEQGAASYEVARALGAGPWRRFWGLGLPLARPAMAAGVAIVMMETAADFGVVEYFGVQTLTTGIFTTWLEANNVGGAAQIAGVLLVIVFMLLGVEKFSRRTKRYHNWARNTRPLSRVTLTGPNAGLACLACLVPISIGFVLPLSVILNHAMASEHWVDPGLFRAFTNTLIVCASAAVLTVGVALVFAFGARLTGRGLSRFLLPLTSLGYATPGAVLAVGILIPLAALDHSVADTVEMLTGWDPGLILTGSAAALAYAYMVRFFAIAQGAADTALGRISPSLPMAARSLGRSPAGVLRQVHVPLMRRSILVALLLVFVDSVKELPATLLLRPFNFNTLSTRVYEQASLENIRDAAPAALLITVVGLVAVAFLARSSPDG